MTVDFDTKIKVILRNDLEPWQELNVTAFLMSGIAGTQNIIGEPYEDGDGVKYLPMSQQPISPMNLFVLQRDSADNIANEMLLPSNDRLAA